VIGDHRCPPGVLRSWGEQLKGCADAHARAADLRRYPTPQRSVAESDDPPATSKTAGQRPFLPSGREGLWRSCQRDVNKGRRRTGANGRGSAAQLCRSLDEPPRAPAIAASAAASVRSAWGSRGRRFRPCHPASVFAGERPAPLRRGGPLGLLTAEGDSLCTPWTNVGTRWCLAGCRNRSRVGSRGEQPTG